MIDVTIEVPIVPEGAPRPRATTIGRRPRVYVPTKAQAYKHAIAYAARVSALGQMPMLTGPLRVDVLAVLPRPKRLMRRADPDGLMWAPVKPDCDNVAKNVYDALSCFWDDDAQVVCGEVLKMYAEKTGHPRLVIRIRDAGDASAALRKVG